MRLDLNESPGWGKPGHRGSLVLFSRLKTGDFWVPFLEKTGDFVHIGLGDFLGSIVGKSLDDVLNDGKGWRDVGLEGVRINPDLFRCRIPPS